VDPSPVDLENDCWKSRGSKLRVQLYVNRFEGELSEAVLTAPELSSLGAAGAKSIKWTSPLEANGCREYQDDEFLEHITQANNARELREFWPSGGPMWDALGIVSLKEGEGVVLVEGKSYVGEMYALGCQAGAPDPKTGKRASQRSRSNRKQIAMALWDTQEWLAIYPPDPQRWMGPLYQTANRIAHLYWLREVIGVPAWLVYLLFVDDPIEPTSEEQWAEGIDEANRELGLDTVELPDLAHVCLPAREARAIEGVR
jgi:hypothetical protein